jgi:N-acetylglucosaminyl-diphospho-decaprenol L-rhamnosyltransferase
MQLGIVIVNYKTPALVIDCLTSLELEVQMGQDRVVVVDNASGDRSVEQIEAAIAQHHWSEWAQVLPSTTNGGFSAGNNLGIKALDADAYLLLNSDTLVRPGALDTLKKVLQERPDAGIIGPRLEWPDGTPQISCFRHRSPLSETIASAATGPVTKLLKSFDVPLPVSESSMEPDWLSFACALIRREVVDRIGLMDEGYFMYREDNDYCRRAQEAGWKILYWPQARVVHLRGGSGPVKAAISNRKRPPQYFYASRSRYFAKFYGKTGLWAANLLWIAGRSLSLAREWVGNKSPHTCDREAIDIWTNWREPMKQESPPRT